MTIHDKAKVTATETDTLINKGTKEDVPHTRESATEKLNKKYAGERLYDNANAHHIFAYILYDLATQIETDDAFQDKLMERVRDSMCLKDICMHEGDTKMGAQLGAANVIFKKYSQGEWALTGSSLFSMIMNILRSDESINILIRKGSFDGWYLIFRRIVSQCHVRPTYISPVIGGNGGRVRSVLCSHIQINLCRNPTGNSYLTVDKLRECSEAANMLTHCDCKELINQHLVRDANACCHACTLL